MADIIQLRRDTAANWTSANPVLAQGELGVETDTSKIKVGDGTTAWSSLVYLINTGDYLVSTGAVKPVTYEETYTPVSSSGNSLTIDTSTATVFDITLTENVTNTAFINPPASGTAYGMTLLIKQNATGNFTFAWPASVVWDAATPVAPTLTASAVDVFVLFTHDAGTTWYAFKAGQAMG